MHALDLRFVIVLLQHAARLGGWSLGLFALTVSLLLPAFWYQQDQAWWLLPALAFLLMAQWYRWRLCLDVALLQTVATETDEETALVRLDHVLHRACDRSAAKSTRSIEQRMRGMHRLVVWQCVGLAGQVLCLPGLVIHQLL